MLKIAHQCSGAFFGLGHKCLQKGLVNRLTERPFKWPPKSVRQSTNNRLTCGRRECWSSRSISVALRLTVCVSFLEYLLFWINFFTMKELEYLSEILWDYCLDVYLSVSKRISLDDHPFIVIFIVKVGEKVGFSSFAMSSKQGKKYQYSGKLRNNYNFSS